MNLSLPALLHQRYKEEEAFKAALKQDKLSEIRTSDHFIENYDYLGACDCYYWFKNRFDGMALMCPK